MLRYFFIFTLFLAGLQSTLFSQQIVFKQDFNNVSLERAIIGIDGNGLNLTQSAKERSILKYEIDKEKWRNSFTVSAWVKAERDFESYNILDLEIQYQDSSKVHWKFNKQVNHTWAWELEKGKIVLDYKPGNTRQLITEGWSLISMSYNPLKEEVTLYYNDLQVAIYSVQGTSLKSTIKTIGLSVGGQKQGELGEWEVFNGCIDNILIYDEELTKGQITKIYKSFFPSSSGPLPPNSTDTLRVMTYNIWHGGNETGKGIGYKRVAEIIKASKADVVTMQETYGSGARIADELGYYFYLRSSNISIMSRYPIQETLKSYNAFNNGNAIIEVGDKKIVIASVWLNYPVDYWGEIDKGNKIDLGQWLKAQEDNKNTMQGIIGSFGSDIIEKQGIPVIIGGDFNSGSHLDWIESVKDQNAGYVMAFPTGKYLGDLGFNDTFRQVYPDPKINRGTTWTPIDATTHQDRIDYIFSKGQNLKTIDSQVIDTHPVRYPSDHAAVVTTFMFIK